MSDQQILRVREVFGTLVRNSGLKLASLERGLGVSRGYLRKLLEGRSQLKVEHLLGVLEILGVAPSEFFSLAFPPVAEASALVAQLEGIVVPRLRVADAETARVAPAPRQWTREEVQEIVTRVIEEMDRRGPPPAGGRGARR